MRKISVVEKIKTHFIFNNFFRKSCRLWGRIRQGKGDSILRRMWFPLDN